MHNSDKAKNAADKDDDNDLEMRDNWKNKKIESWIWVKKICAALGINRNNLLRGVKLIKEFQGKVRVHAPIFVSCL